MREERGIPKRIREKGLVILNSLSVGLPIKCTDLTERQRLFVLSVFETRLVLSAIPEEDSMHLLERLLAFNAPMFSEDANPSSPKAMLWAKWLLDEYMKVEVFMPKWKAEFVRFAFLEPELKYSLDFLHPMVSDKNKFRDSIRCLKHGNINVTANYLLQHQECPVCHRERKDNFDKQVKNQYDWARRYKSISYKRMRIGNTDADLSRKTRRNIRYTQAQFEESIRKVHGERFDLSQAIYQGSKTEVKVICNNCEKAYYVRPDELRRSYVCNCWKDAMFSDCKTSSDSKLAKIVEKNDYKFGTRYLIVDDEIGCTRFGALCFEHGHYFDHKYFLRGCPECFPRLKNKDTAGELIIADWLQDNSIDYIPQYEINNNDRIFKADFFLPFYNTIIEFNGQQHYECIPYFHETEDDFILQQKRDKDLLELCNKKGIRVLTIRYDELDDIGEILAKELNISK